MSESRPLILVTNDDGIDSPGLHAAVGAVAPLGELLVVAPMRQQTAAGRSFPPSEFELIPRLIALDGGEEIEAYALDGSPAQAVRAALMLLTGRRPDVLVSGINYGENVGVGVTISGTVGAAIEGATFGVPGLAVSLETDLKEHREHSNEVDFRTAAFFTQRFAKMMLDFSLPPNTDLLKLDVPSDATPETPWRITRVSRQSYYISTVEEIEDSRRFSGYRREVDYERLEPDSDVHAIMVDRVISLAPMTIDLTAREDLWAMALEARQALGPDTNHSWPPGPQPTLKR